MGRAVRDREPIHVEDILALPETEFPETMKRVRETRAQQGTPARTMLATPLLREGVPIGVIFMRRTEVQPFTDKQVELAKTFADQAVIAIENVRLFTELEARNRELTEALEQQTATAEILRVISSSPTGVQPVFDAIARSATTLCEADLSGLFTFDGELIHLEAQHGRTPEEVDAVRRAFPQPPGRSSVTARAILEVAAVQVPEHSKDPDVADTLRMYQTVLAVPMIRDGRPIGAISVARRVVRPFTDKQIALLKTFADQAVIAIENVRLFQELQARNEELTGALARQTATSEILQVISRSPTATQPVFEAIVKSASRLLGGAWSALMNVREGAVHVAALRAFRRPKGPDSGMAGDLSSRPRRRQSGRHGCPHRTNDKRRRCPERPGGHGRRSRQGSGLRFPVLCNHANAQGRTRDRGDHRRPPDMGPFTDG